MRKVESSILARGTKIFVAQGEHSFSFFHVKIFTGSVSVLLTSASLKILKKLKIKNGFVGPGVGHLTDLVLPGKGIFESFFARRGDI